MRTMRALSRRATDILITLLVVANLCMIAFQMHLRMNQSYGLGIPFPAPSGYVVDGSFVRSTNAPCYLLRVSSEGCLYCRSDLAEYSQMTRVALSRGCVSVIVGPRKGDLRAPTKQDGTLYLELVGMQFGRALVPDRTPQTIVADGKGVPVWYQLGALDSRTVSKGLSVLERMR